MELIPLKEGIPNTFCLRSISVKDLAILLTQVVHCVQLGQSFSSLLLEDEDVLDFLRSRGASKDPTRVIVPIAPSEFKVYDYLVETAACNQTKEHVNEFLEKCKSYKLAKAEVLNIINLRPSALVEIDPIIEQSEMRFGEELVELVNLVVEVLPEPSTQKNAEEESNEDKEETSDGKNVDENERETANDERIDEDQSEQTEDGEKMEVSAVSLG